MGVGEGVGEGVGDGVAVGAGFDASTGVFVGEGVAVGVAPANLLSRLPPTGVKASTGVITTILIATTNKTIPRIRRPITPKIA